MNQDAKRRPSKDLHRGVVLVLLAAATLGIVAAFSGSVQIADPTMIATCIAMLIATGILIGVAKAQAAREDPSSLEGSSKAAEVTPKPTDAEGIPPLVDNENSAPLRNSKGLNNFFLRWPLVVDFDVRGITAVVGISAIVFLLFQDTLIVRPSSTAAGIGIAFSLFAAGLVAVTARYFAEIDFEQFPEGRGLCQGARLLGWILVLLAMSVLFAWANLFSLVRLSYYLVLAVDAAVCYGLFSTRRTKLLTETEFPLTFGVLPLLGGRANVLASVLDAAQREFGIDLRSTWALTIVRRTLEPLTLSLFMLGWLSTSLTVLGMDEQGLIERIGVQPASLPLGPGLHLHWPWPIDQIFRVSVRHVQTVQVGHEGVENDGPEDVLWAVEHAPNEYTLLLGNGRDLITVDAAVQYRIIDAHAWRYSCQNPAVALRAIAYRAVMRSTVNLTLSDALSQNVAMLTEKMRSMVQGDADNLGLGVQILTFTVSGMHPPVPVASAYEAVVSAELGKTTAIVRAQAFRNQTVPAAESSVVSGLNTARADGAEDIALAAGQAWSFRTLEADYRAAPGEYFFRRRLETLEQTLPPHPYTVVDSRFLRDGGEIWTTQ